GWEMDQPRAGRRSRRAILEIAWAIISAPALRYVSADASADGRDGTGRRGASAPAGGRGRGGALPGARPATARGAARTRADSARRPRRPALVSPRDARRA